MIFTLQDSNRADVFTYHRIIGIHNGRIYFINTLLPQGKEFFAEGTGGCDYATVDPRTADDTTISVTTLADCTTNVNCQDCPAGTFNTGSGYFCKWCPNGEVANAAKVGCDQCVAVRNYLRNYYLRNY